MKLILYQNSKIQLGDVIENSTTNNIFSYLETLKQETINNLQLSKSIFDNIEFSIKIDKETNNIDLNSCNYACIENEGEFYFYFITNKSWIAESTTKLSLYLDTLNTFEYKNKIVSNTENYELCNVIREHRDRFNEDKKVQIDKVDEGFGTLPMVLNYTKLIGDKEPYYLAYYKTKDENARYYTQFVSKSGEKLDLDVYQIATKYKDFIQSGESIVIMSSNPNEELLYKSGDNISNINLIYLYYNTLSSDYVKINTSGYFYTSNSIYMSSASTLDYNHDVTIECGKIIKVLKGKRVLEPDFLAKKIWTLDELLGDDYETIEYTTKGKETVELPSIDSLLKADNTILKITEVPYLDLDVIQPYYLSDTSSLIATTYDEMLGSEVTFNYGTMYQVVLPSTFSKIPHDKQYETKLLGSQFTLNQFKYDTFNYNLSLEDLDINQDVFNVETYIPNNMSNNIGFKFDYDGVTRNEFDRWLLCSRNNQYPTLNNDYLDYMQNGYNYDVKNRAIQSGMNWLNFAGQVGGATLGGIASSVNFKSIFSDMAQHLKSKREGLRVPAFLKRERDNRVIESALAGQQLYNVATGVVSTLANNIIYDVQSKQAMEQRQKDYLNSAVNVSGSDDLSLFHTYNGDNKLRFSQFKPESYIYDSVYEIMRLTGYNTNQYKIPDLRSRVDYNYLQADVTFKGGYYIPNVMMSDIKTLINNGVTLFHNYGGIYDLDRQYENWERKFADEPEPSPTELSNLVLSGRCYLNEDGTFKQVIWSLTNPNDVKVYFNGSIYVDDEAQSTTTLEFNSGETITGTKTYAGKVLYVNGVLTSDGTIETKPISLSAKCILNDDCTFNRVEYTLTNNSDTSLTFSGKMGVDDNLVDTEFTLGINEGKSGKDTTDGNEFIIEGDIK